MSEVSTRPIPPLNDSHSIERVTSQALEAALAGDWDQVDACYNRRQIGLDNCIIDRAVAQRLLIVDEHVRTAILVAQAGLSGLLAEAAQARRQLRRLRESAGQFEPEGGALHREA